MTMRDGAIGARRRWLSHVLARYDAQKRPRLSAWIIAIIVGIIALFGVLGYAIPTLVSRFM